MKHRSLALFATAISLVACTTPSPRPTAEMHTKFVGADHEIFRQSGTGTIKGQGFLRQKGGGTVTCAGSTVSLLPSTPFFKEMLEHLKNGRQIALGEKVNVSYKSILKQSQCDAQGNFTFSGLPTATWYVSTMVKWSVGHSQQGGGLLREVSSIDNETIQVLLTDGDLVGR